LSETVRVVGPSITRRALFEPGGGSAWQFHKKTAVGSRSVTETS